VQFFSCTIWLIFPHSHHLTLSSLQTWLVLLFICGVERTCWRLIQKRVVRTKFDIYVFILACKNVQTINMTCSVVHVYYPKSAICTNMACSVVHVYYLKSTICTNMTCSVVHVYYLKSAICTNMTCSVVHVYYLKSAICTNMTCSVVLLWLCGDMIKVIPETSRAH
jgi:hypothetical protein